MAFWDGIPIRLTQSAHQGRPSMLEYSTRQTRVQWAVLAGTLALVLVACGGGDTADTADTADTTDTTARGTTAATSAPTSTSGSAAAPTDDFEPQTIQVGHAVWHSGFKIDVLEGEFSREEVGLSSELRYFFTLDVSYENLGPFDTFFDGQMALVAGGDSFVYDNFGGDNVASGLSSTAELKFRVEEDFDAANAQLIIGSSDETRATVPLGPGGGEVVALAPMDIDVAGTLSMELIDLEFTGGDLRYDVPAKYRQVDAGEIALTLTFDVTSRKGGNWSVFADNFALVLPDGKSIGVDGSELENIAGSDAGTTTSDLAIRFLVDDPAGGAYSVRFTPGNWFVGEDEVTEATFGFTLE
jgi:hypothetical protein